MRRRRRNYHKESIMYKSQDKSWVPKPEVAIIWSHKRGSYNYIVLIFGLKGHTCNNDFKFGS